MDAFDVAFERLIGSEGAFSDNPDDPGNWTGGAVGEGELKGTKYGIAANTYGHLDIKNLTLEQAKAIYKRDYYDVIGDVHAALKFQLFDFATNSGKETAIRKLQAAIGVADDGKFGPISKAKLAAMDVNDVLMRYIAQRLRFWTSLSTWGTFGKGWSRRAATDLEYAATDNPDGAP